jgi:signal peptidase I
MEDSRPHIQPITTSPEPKVERGQPTEAIILEIVETLLLTFFIFWIVNSGTGRFRIEGHSMMPTLKEGEYIIINKLAYYLDEPQRGDVIVLRFPNDRERDFIKRVIGVPGDQIEIAEGEVRVNGMLLHEPYINASPRYEDSWVVPENNYFVLGDNRNNSSDSHNWSFLPREDIVGKAWLIYWAPKDWGLVPHYSHPLG